MVLSIRSLSKRYAPTEPWALHDVHLHVNEGEFIAILGSSGAGKSTLIRCINRLVEPSRGTIVWNGEDVTALDTVTLRQHRRLMGMVFQEFHLIDRLDVLTNVLVGALGSLSPWRGILRRFPATVVHKAWNNLDRVGLADYAFRQARELSGGQRQRVAIARVLTQQPRLILGDEPVSNLDPASTQDVMELLEKVNGQDGITMILNLHSVELARRYARRIIGLKKGRIIFDGPPAALTSAALDAIYDTGTRQDTPNRRPA